MQDKRSKVNILAPAGSEDQLIAAVNNGCDAVYLGLDSFNARLKAPNFTLDNLSNWVDYCHLFGVKVYVAINTSVKNDEFNKAADLLYEVYKSCADGVIVTDLALMRIASSLPKPFEVVASTQLSIHDKYGAEFVKKLGATTIVCARECSLNDIKEIAQTGIGVECFLHGAMCVCQSGQCLFSSMVGGNSGNRGLCAQPCRKLYRTEDGASGYLLSARDICSLDTLSQLIDAGATTFKIEGRSRRAEYAGITSRIYREIIDRGISVKDDRTNLAEMFNRNMSSNRYLQGRNDDIVYPVTQNHTGVPVGVIRNGGVMTNCYISKGDGLKVFDGDRELCGGVALESGSGNVRAQFGGRVGDGMRVHRTTSVALCKDVASTKRKLKVRLTFTAKAGDYARLDAECSGVTANVTSDFVVPAAQNKPTNEQEIIAQLSKTADTYYTICDIVTQIDDIFIAKSQINALRRQIIGELTAAIIASYNEKFGCRKDTDISVCKDFARLNNLSNCKSTALAVNCCCEDELKKVHGVVDYLIYAPESIDNDAVTAAIKYDAFLDLPPLTDLKYLSILAKDNKLKIVCHNVGQVEFARLNNLSYIAGAGLNIFNDKISNVFYDAETFLYSQELTLKEIADFKISRGLTFVDGKINLMKLSHCPYKLVLGCDCSTCRANKKLTYVDEMGNKFYVMRRRAGKCLFVLVNGNKLSVVNRLKRGGRYLVDFDEAVVRHYLQLNNGIDDNYTESLPYTKGRLFDKIN